MTCEAITTPGTYPYLDAIACGEFTDTACVYCGLGVCIRCELGCYSCGLPLHDGCRADHAKEKGHDVDRTKLRLSNMDVFVERVMRLVGRA